MYGYIDSIEQYQITEMLKGNNGLEEGQYNVTDSTTINGVTYEKVNKLVSVKGKKPTGGKVGITKDKTVGTATLCINNYVIEYSNKEAKVISEDCGDMGLLINYQINSSEWELSKSLTITYPEGKYEYYFKLESGTATLNGETIELNKEIKIDASEVTVELQENSVVSAWMIKNGKQVALRSYEEKMIDNVEIGVPVISIAEDSYPILTTNGIEVSTKVKIEYDNQEGTSAYYSTDEGVTWKKYTSEVDAETTKIQAKLVRDKSKREGEIVEASISLAEKYPGISDCPINNIYDNDDSTRFSPQNSTELYIKISDEIKGKVVRIKWRDNNSREVIYHTFLDINSNEIGTSVQLSNLTTVDSEYLIPKNAEYLKIYVGYSCDIYEIDFASTTKLDVKELPINMILNSNGVSKSNYNKYTIDYTNSSIQYKIGDSNYKDYNSGFINVDKGNTLYVKAINEYTKEEQISEYVSSQDPEGFDGYSIDNIYDNDDSTRFAPLSSTELNIKLTEEVRGKQLRLKWQDNNSGDVIYHVFLDNDLNEIGTKVQLDNRTQIDSNYDIPENAAYLNIYVCYSCYVYEVGLVS